MYIWRRVTEKIQKNVAKKEVAPVITRKKFDAQKVANVSQLLDMRNNQNH
jgi:hypothetical protein